jgi:hypothetical protein
MREKAAAEFQQLLCFYLTYTAWQKMLCSLLRVLRNKNDKG